MGKKPVIAWTGMILATLSLAGCQCCGSKSKTCTTCANGSCANGSCATPAAQPVGQANAGQFAPQNQVSQPLPRNPTDSQSWNNVNRPQVRTQGTTVDNSDRSYGTMNGVPNPTTVNGVSPATMRSTGTQQVGYGVPAQPVSTGAVPARPTYTAPAPTMPQAQPDPDWSSVPNQARPMPTMPSTPVAESAPTMPARPAVSSSPLQRGNVTETSYPVLRNESGPVVEPQMPELPPAN
jgi:hypothetical protein